MSVPAVIEGFETSDAYPWTHIGVTGSRPFSGWAVSASLGTDVDIFLSFEMPQILPSGTGKLRLLGMANASSGNGVYNPAWKSLATGENYDTSSLNAEGNTTVTWSAGDGVIVESLITLDADTLVADEIVYMALTAVSASWTMAARSTWKASVIWQ